MDAPWLSCYPPHDRPYQNEHDAVEGFNGCHDAVPRSILMAVVPALSEVTPVI